MVSPEPRTRSSSAAVSEWEQCAPRTGLSPKRPLPAETQGESESTGDYSDRLLAKTCKSLLDGRQPATVATFGPTDEFSHLLRNSAVAADVGCRSLNHGHERR